MIDRSESRLIAQERRNRSGHPPQDGRRYPEGKKPAASMKAPKLTATLTPADLTVTPESGTRH